MKKEPIQIYGNYYNKYGTKNPIERYLVNRYHKTLKEILLSIDPHKILDIGCGEGFITNQLRLITSKEVIGMEIGKEVLLKAIKAYPNISFIQGSTYKIPFDDNSFELITALELLEHLEESKTAIRDMKRVCSKWLILSIPLEPLWSVLNIVRFKYLGSFGNTPGHINKWSLKAFLAILGDDFEIIAIKKPLPWIMVLCRVKSF